MTDWYRKKTWSSEDENDFFTRLARARKDSRPQYLKIQAIELTETKEKKLLDVAEVLIVKLFADYPDDKFNRSSALNVLGDIYQIRGNFDTAIDYYKQAIEFEVTYPQVKTPAYLSYSELAVKSNKIDLFDSVESVILERLRDQFFPIEKYKSYTILSIINTYKKNKDQANHYEELANKYANEKTSGLRYHKYLGIVKERDSLLDKLLRRK